MLYLLLLLCFLHSIHSDSTGIGQGFYLPKLSLIEDNGNGKSIFKEIPPECIKAIPSEVNRQVKTYFESTEAFYSEIGASLALSAEVTDGFTLGVTAIAASRSIDSKHLEIKGMSYEVYAMTGFWDFIPDCRTTLELADDLKRVFETLPGEIENPHEARSWILYDTFLKTYGSHVTKRISHGSKIVRHVFSKSSEHISSKQFLIKVCASLMNVNLTLCSNFTDADYDRVASLSTSEELTVRGGSNETRAQLITNVTNELIEKFLTEAYLTEQPISVQYENVWDILKSKYLGTEHFVKAIILESYYLGYLNTGCSFQADRGYELRKFIQTKNSDGIPSFECQLAPMGCRTDSDCHIGGAFASVCYCYGHGCIDKRTLDDPRHTVKTTRYVRSWYDDSSFWQGVNPSCWYHVGVWCACDKSWGGGWKTVWPTQRYSNELQLYRQAQRMLTK